MQVSIDLKKLDSQVQPLIIETGEFIKKEFSHFSEEKVQYKGKTDLFSYVDVQAEKMLMAGCIKILPGSGFIAEESAEEKINAPYMWIIDPVDGTTNFIHGLPIFCISLALYANGEVLLGYTYDILRGEMFSAIKGEGAWLNGAAMKVGTAKQLKDALLGCEMPKKYMHWRGDYWKMMEDLIDGSRGLRRLGSAAMEAAYVAAGRLDIYIEFDLKPWDVAAGTLLVEEAGGRASAFKEGVDVVFGRQFLVSNGDLHEEALAIIRKWAAL